MRGVGQVRRQLATHPLSTLAVSTVTLMEIEFGLGQSPAKRPSVEAALGLWLPQMTILEYSEQDARVTASIRVALKVQGQPVGPYDLLNAGIALARGLTMVTHNVREYSRVEGLDVSDWVDDDFATP